MNWFSLFFLLLHNTNPQTDFFISRISFFNHDSKIACWFDLLTRTKLHPSWGWPCSGPVLIQFRIKSKKWNSSQYNLLVVSPFRRHCVSRSWKNVIVQEIIPCWGLAGSGCEDRQMVPSFIRISSEDGLITQLKMSSVDESCLDQHRAFLPVYFSMPVWKYQRVMY